MSLAPQRLLLLVVGIFLCVSTAQALILYGTGPTDMDNARNTSDPDPSNAASPWKYGVRFGALNASGVYLGKGYFLTANHVDLINDGIVINGATYNRDVLFNPVQVSDGADVTDLKLVRILGNPTLPVTPTLPLNYSETADLNFACMQVGSGVGKGGVITNQGWFWGVDSTAIQRWGTNRTASEAVPVTYEAGPTVPATNYSYDTLVTYFDRSLGSDTGQITFRDSGSGLFQQIDGVWKLSGVATTVSSGGAAKYDNAAPFYANVPKSKLLQQADSPDASYYVRLEKYAPLLRAENWASAKLDDAAASLLADPDHDGIRNLLEYALHADPNVAAISAVPQAAMEGGFLTLTYTQLMSATDLSYVVEESADLGGWVAATVTNEVLSTSGVTRIVKAKVAIGPATRKFLRLKVARVL